MDLKIIKNDTIKLPIAKKYIKEDVNIIVEVPIPDEYIIPSGTIDIADNGVFDVTSYAEAHVDVMAAKPEQSKNVLPTKDTQTVTPDDGYTLSEVIVEPIPEDYIIPEGTLDIAENGVYDVTANKNVNVTVKGEDTLLQRLNKTLTHVNIDETVEEIPPYCFYGCYRLKDVVIPGNVKKIGQHSFQNCTNIGSIVLEEGIEKIETYAFYYSSYDANGGSGGFEYVTIPSTVTTIDQYAFGYCKCLKEINVPPLVAKLDRTFAYCSKLEKLIMEPINPPTFINTFLGNNFNTYTKTGEIWIEHSEAVDNYLEATNWSAWAPIMNTYAWVSKIGDHVLSPGEVLQLTASTMGVNPQLSIICSNDNINTSVTNDGSITIEAIKEGTTQITVKVVAGENGEYEFTRTNTIVVSNGEVQEVSIESVADKYAFIPDSSYEDEDGETGYYVSTNTGVDSSQSVAKVVLNLLSSKTVYVDCILDSRLQLLEDGYYDGPLIGKLDSDCPDIVSIDEDGYYEAINTKKSFPMEYEMDYFDDELPMKNVYKYGTVDTGLHYFYIVYHKDQYKGKSGSDTFKFKIRVEE